MRYSRVLLSILLVPVTIECAVRVDDWVSYGASPLENFNQDSLYTFDALGQRGKPMARYLKWQLNSLGFRGPDLIEGTRRIGVVGSSETFGLYESPGKEWPRLVEECLNRGVEQPALKFQLVNFAYPGMLLSTFERRLPEYIEKAKPNQVLIYPSYAGYLYRDLDDPLGEKPVVPPAPQKLQLRITSRAQEVVKKVTPRFVQDYLRKRQLERAADQSPKTWTKVPEEYLVIFRDDLRRVISKLRERRVEPVLVTHATYFGDRVEDADKSMLIAWRKFYPMLEESGFLDLEQRFSELLRNEAMKAQVRLIDMAKIMPRGARYFADFTHFTDEGSELMAANVCRELKAQG